MPITPNAAGPLVIGGVAAEDLAHAYGTPLLAIDTDLLDAEIARFADRGAKLGFEVAYAAKALLFVALAARLARSPLALDVCSLGELLTAERGGFPADRLVLHGCAKTDAELDAALAGRVGRIVLDSLDEIARLGARAAATPPAGRQLAALLRVNSGVEAHTHAYVRTGGDDSKFGFALEDVSAAASAVAAIPALRLAGLHTHLGSQIFEREPYVAGARAMLAAYARLAAQGCALGELVIGGGFGVGDDAAADGAAIDAALEAVATAVRAASAAGRFALPRLGIEPGRSLVARAGTSLYRVFGVKRQGAVRYAIVDGSIADNPRPALYGAVHAPSLASRVSEATAVPTTVSGRSCENDRLATADLPEDMRAGDLLAMETTGAYTYSMASNYNRFSKPAVVFAGAGAHRLVVRRQDAIDVLREDIADEA